MWASSIALDRDLESRVDDSVIVFNSAASAAPFKKDKYGAPLGYTDNSDQYARAQFGDRLTWSETYPCWQALTRHNRQVIAVGKNYTILSTSGDFMPSDYATPPVQELGVFRIRHNATGEEFVVLSVYAKDDEGKQVEQINYFFTRASQLARAGPPRLLAETGTLLATTNPRIGAHAGCYVRHQPFDGGLLRHRHALHHQLAALRVPYRGRRVEQRQDSHGPGGQRPWRDDDLGTTASFSDGVQCTKEGNSAGTAAPTSSCRPQHQIALAAGRGAGLGQGLTWPGHRGGGVIAESRAKNSSGVITRCLARPARAYFTRSAMRPSGRRRRLPCAIAGRRPYLQVRSRPMSSPAAMWTPAWRLKHSCSAANRSLAGRPSPLLPPSWSSSSAASLTNAPRCMAIAARASIAFGSADSFERSSSGRSSKWPWRRSHAMERSWTRRAMARSSVASGGGAG